MAQRPPTPTIEETERLQAVASPVETYVRPAKPQPSSLWDLAEGLKGFDRDLSGFLAERRAKADKDDAIRGEAEFYRNNQEGFAEAVRSGKVPAFASPAFKAAYRRAEGSATGVRLSAEATEAYATWGGKDESDPDNFNKFMAGYLKQRLGPDTDPDFLQGVLPHVRQTHDQLSAKAGVERANRSYQKGVEGHGAGAAAAVDAENRRGLDERTGTNYDTVWSDLMAKREAAIRSGLRPEDFDKTMWGIIADKAVEHRDPGLLKLFERQVPGTNYKFSDTPEGREVVGKTVSRMTDLALKMERERERQQAARDKQEFGALQSDIIGRIFRDPNAEVTEAEIARGSKVDPEFRAKVQDIRKKALEGGKLEDPRAVNEVYERVANGGGVQAVFEAVRSGAISNPATVSTMMTHAERFSRGGDGARQFLRSESAERIRKTIQVRTLDPNVKLENPLDPRAQAFSDAGLAALRDYDRLLLEWMEKNPDAAEAQKNEAATTIGAAVLKQIDAARGTYNPAEGAVPPGNPFQQPRPAGQAQQQQREPASADKPKRLQEQVKSARPEDPAPKFESMPPEERTLVEREAKRLGVPPQMVVDQMWKRLREFMSRRQGEAGQAPAATGGDGPTGSISRPVRDTSQPTDADEARGLAEPAVQRGTVREIAEAVDNLGRTGGSLAESLGSVVDGIGATAETPGRAAARVLSESARTIAMTLGPRFGAPMAVAGVIAEAAKSIGVSPVAMFAIAKRESAFRPGAKAKTSSASGLYQFIDSTWRTMVRKYGKEYGFGLGDRFDPRANAIAGALFIRDNAAGLRKVLGREPKPGELYVAHFMGLGGATKLLRLAATSPNASAASLFPREAAANRPIYYDRGGRPRTIAQVLANLTNTVPEA